MGLEKQADFVVNILKKFLLSSDTFCGITFSGCYDMNMDDFFELLHHYIKTGENNLDIYSEIIHASWGAENFSETVCSEYKKPTKEQIERIGFLLSEKSPVIAANILKEETFSSLYKHYVSWKEFYERKHEESINKQTRNFPEYDNWRTSVFERDSYTCQKCGKIGGELNAHHIKSYSGHKKLRLDIDNGITLCASPCHKKEHKKK